MRGQLHVGSRLSWIVAWLLALAAPAITLFWPGDATWWLALVLVAPVVTMAAWRADQRGGAGQAPGDGLPWGPP